MRILVVDDSATMRSIIQKELHALNERDLVIRNSGDAALGELDKGGVDLVLLDWHMEGLSGLDVLRIVKHNPKYKSIPVIMLTVEEHNKSVQEAMESGADDYMVKPLNPALLKEKLAKFSAK
ncbi:MAG: response regulator [Fibrobacterota bacterium]